MQYCAIPTNAYKCHERSNPYIPVCTCQKIAATATLRSIQSQAARSPNGQTKHCGLMALSRAWGSLLRFYGLIQRSSTVPPGCNICNCPTNSWDWIVGVLWKFVEDQGSNGCIVKLWSPIQPSKQQSSRDINCSFEAA